MSATSVSAKEEHSARDAPNQPRGDHDLIVVAASAGGVEALVDLVKGLPAKLPAAIAVVLHMRETGTSHLPQILSRAGPLPAHHPVDGEPILRQHIYVAPPNQHLLVRPGYFHIWDGPRENRVRPAADPLFRSAARSYERRVGGVVLSGMLDDGSAGIAAIKGRGGVTIVQDPREARFPGMPESAIATGSVDYKLPVDQIAPLLVQLASDRPDVEETWSLAHTQAQTMKGGTSGPMEPPEAADAPNLDYAVQHPTTDAPSGLMCPDCGGALWERTEDGVMRFRCHVGHAFSPETMLSAQAESIEMALWNATRALRERAALLRRVAEYAPTLQNMHMRESAREDAEAYDQQAELIRGLLLRHSQ